MSWKKDWNISRNARRKTKHGMVEVMYNHQKQASKRRNHPMPDYSVQELREWLNTQPNFNSLYEAWVNSGHKKELKPSCDRLDDYAPYTISNLRLVTWEENNKRANEDVVKGINNKNSKKVRQYKDGVLVGEFYSMTEAARQLGLCNKSISKCCRGNRKTYAGFEWAVCG